VRPGRSHIRGLLPLGHGPGAPPKREGDLARLAGDALAGGARARPPLPRDGPALRGPAPRPAPPPRRRRRRGRGRRPCRSRRGNGPVAQRHASCPIRPPRASPAGRPRPWPRDVGRAALALGHRGCCGTSCPATCGWRGGGAGGDRPASRAAGVSGGARTDAAERLLRAVAAPGTGRRRARVSAGLRFGLRRPSTVPPRRGRPLPRLPRCLPPALGTPGVRAVLARRWSFRSRCRRRRPRRRWCGGRRRGLRGREGPRRARCGPSTAPLPAPAAGVRALASAKRDRHRAKEAVAATRRGARVAPDSKFFWRTSFLPRRRVGRGASVLPRTASGRPASPLASQALTSAPRREPRGSFLPALDQMSV
jgi:hypothetical protein